MKGRTRTTRGAAFVLTVALAVAATLALSGNALAETGVQCAPTGLEMVATDKDDYPPGSTVHVTGAGYALGCDVEVRIERPDGVAESFAATTDLVGSFALDHVLPGPPGVIGEYRITVHGLDGATLASMTFTDAAGAIEVVPAHYPAPSPSSQERHFTVLGRVLAAPANGAKCVRLRLPNGFSIVSGSQSFEVGAGSGWTLALNSISGSPRELLLSTSSAGNTGLPGSGTTNWARFDLRATTPAGHTSPAWDLTFADNAACTTNPNTVQAGVRIANATNLTYAADFRDASGNVVSPSVTPGGPTETFRLRITNNSGGDGDKIIYAGFALPKCFANPTGVSVATSNGGRPNFSFELRDRFIRLSGGELEKDQNPDEYVEVTFTSSATVSCANASHSFWTSAWKSSQTSATATDNFNITGNHAAVQVAPATQPTSVSNVSGGGTYGETATLTAKLTSGATNLSGKTILFTLGAVGVGSAVTDGDGVATLSGVSLASFNAGTHVNAVGASFAGDVGYDPSTGSGNLTVLPKSVTVTPDSGQGKVYGDADPNLTYTLSESVPVTGALGRATGENIGTYAIDLGSLATTSGNHALVFSSTPVNFTIEPAVLSVNAVAASKTYGDADPAFGSALSGYVNGEDADSAAVAGEADCSRTAGESVAGSPYTITCEPGTLAAPNYTFVAGATADFEIEPAVLSVNAVAASKTYGDADPAFGSALSGYVNGEDADSAAVAGEADCSRTAGESVAGSPYTITCEPGTLAAPNYTFVAGATADFEIEPAVLSVNAVAASKTYGDADPAFGSALSGYVNGEDADSAAVAGEADCSRTAGESVAGSPYTITCAPGTLAAPNYTFVAGATADFEIEPAVLSVNAVAASKTYGDADPAFGSALSGFVNGEDGASAAVAGEADCSRTAGESVAGSPYTITCEPGTLAAPNYTFVAGDTAEFTVTKRPVTASITAADKVYDGTTAAIAECSLDAAGDGVGVVEGDDIACQAGNAEFESASAGSGKQVTADVGLTGEAAGNYELTSDTAATSATIAPAPLTVTADSTSKDLGAPDPSFGVTYEGFVAGEDASVLAGTLVLTFQGVAPTAYGPSTTPPQKRGNYTITPSGLQSGNYDITFLAGYYGISGAFFLFLDEEAIRKGSPPSGFTAPSFTDADVNESKVRIGQRDPLAWFANPANYGSVIDLPSGQVGDEAWFTMKTVPSKWASAGPTNNGLRNLLRAGPGLGGGSSREALLDKIRDVTPLRATGLKLLEGSTVCAIVWKSDISINYGPLNGSLKGDNRGILAFEVVAVTRHGSGSTLPRVSVMVLDANVTNGVCSEPLALHGDAPIPTSSSRPMDVSP